MFLNTNISALKNFCFVYIFKIFGNHHFKAFVEHSNNNEILCTKLIGQNYIYTQARVIISLLDCNICDTHDITKKKLQQNNKTKRNSRIKIHNETMKTQRGRENCILET